MMMYQLLKERICSSWKILFLSREDNILKGLHCAGKQTRSYKNYFPLTKMAGKDRENCFPLTKMAGIPFHLKPIAPRKAKTVYNLGLSECNTVKITKFGCNG